jgi:hypothetical protein
LALKHGHLPLMCLGVISANDWLYVSGDDQRIHAYEVNSVSTTTVTTFLPYAGLNSGSGLTITNMGTNPQYGDGTSQYQIEFYNDSNWIIRGLYDYTNNSGSYGSFRVRFSRGITLSQVVAEDAAGYSDTGFSLTGVGQCMVENFRAINQEYGFRISSGVGDDCVIKNGLIDGTTFSAGILIDSPFNALVEQVEFGVYYVFRAFSAETGCPKVRNCDFGAATVIADGYDDYALLNINIEDFESVGDFARVKGEDAIGSHRFLANDGTTVRTGGASNSLKVIPPSVMEKDILAEEAIYATTDSKTYTYYFKTNDSSEWTANLTADDLWIEADYWAHATNRTRITKKSTGTVNFTGSTSWQSISITIQPETGRINTHATLFQ